MKEVIINVREELSKWLEETIKKDLRDNERICVTCHGLGVVKVDRPYGIRGDMSERAKKSRFPYSHETLIPCPSCYNGVQKLCEYCGKPIQREYIDKCDCEPYLKKEEAERLAKWNEVIKNAKEIKIEEVKTMLYCAETDKYFIEVEDFLDDWECDHDEDEKMPEILWVTAEVSLSFDAGNILENACDDLHEDASDNCDINELQKILDEYAAKQTGTKTYYPSFKEYIRIPK